MSIRTGEQDQELLASEAVGEIERAQPLAQVVGDVAQHRVADGMPVSVVDALEVIEIDDDHPDRSLDDSRLVAELIDADAEGTAVEHAGQWVDHRRAAVLQVGPQEGQREEGDRPEQSEREHDVLGVVQRAGRVDDQRADQNQAGGDEAAGDHAANIEARCERDDGEDEPRDRRAAPSARQRDTRRDRQLGTQPRRREPELRV